MYRKRAVEGKLQMISLGLLFYRKKSDVTKKATKILM